MTYNEAIEYIHGVSNFFCKPGLDRIKELCQGLGNPQNKLRFIHVAGTNGKGSFCAMLDSVLREAGYKVGLFTSPYVRHFSERMRTDGENIPSDTLSEITEQVKAVADNMSDRPTEFEVICAIAFEYFRREGCDVVVLEVGMGGRLDATNIIDPPLLSVITGIAKDHTAFLGETIEKIAAEKAGIIKTATPVLYGGEDKTAREVIRAVCQNHASPFYTTDYNMLNIKAASLDGAAFDYRDKEDISISLSGLYQPRNACVVIDAVKILNEQGISISDLALREGLRKAKWQARFEIIGREPLIIFDGAHNPQGVSCAVESIRHYFGDKRVVIFTGVLRDKDYRQVAASLSEVALHAFTITPDSPRALNSEEYADVLRNKGINATACHSTEEALERGIAMAREKDTSLCCLGSLYTYSEIMDILA